MTLDEKLDELLKEKYDFEPKFRELLYKDKRIVEDYMQDYLASNGSNTPEYVLETYKTK